MVEDLAAEHVIDKPVAHEIDRQILPGSQQDFAEVGDDDPFVRHARGDKKHIAMVGYLDGPTVDDRAHAFQGVLREEVTSSHEIVVADLQCGRQQAADVDLRAGAEQDAVRVQQEDAAVRLQPAENDGGIGSHNSIQGNRVDRRLHEANAFVGRDRKTLPVENGLIRGLLDGQGFGIGLLNGRVAADHFPIAWEGRCQAGEQNLKRG